VASSEAADVTLAGSSAGGKKTSPSDGAADFSDETTFIFSKGTCTLWTTGTIADAETGWREAVGSLGAEMIGIESILGLKESGGSSLTLGLECVSSRAGSMLLNLAFAGGNETRGGGHVADFGSRSRILALREADSAVTLEGRGVKPTILAFLGRLRGKSPFSAVPLSDFASIEDSAKTGGFDTADDCVAAAEIGDECAEGCEVAFTFDSCYTVGGSILSAGMA
jgi:hypothetical protein